MLMETILRQHCKGYLVEVGKLSSLFTFHGISQLVKDKICLLRLAFFSLSLHERQQRQRLEPPQVYKLAMSYFLILNCHR